jgi:RNA polymerase sigma-70 factor (ECF subfamily)
MNALIALLDPDVVRRADRNALPPDADTEVHGAYNVIKETVTNTGLAQHARIALVNGSVGLIVVLRRQLRVALSLTIENDKLTEIDVIADPARLRVTTLAVLEEA